MDVFSVSKYIIPKKITKKAWIFKKTPYLCRCIPFKERTYTKKQGGARRDDAPLLNFLYHPSTPRGCHTRPHPKISPETAEQ